MADNRIAYGLAKKYGIDTSGMKPKEVWEALKKKGVTEENISDGAYDSKENKTLATAKKVKTQSKDYEEFFVPDKEQDDFKIKDMEIYEQGEINGVVRSGVKTFYEADNNNTNPNFNDSDDYKINCQSCVAVFEARLRGYDLETLPFNEEDEVFNKLCENPEIAYINAKYEKLPLEIVDNYGNDRAITLTRALSNKINEGERHNLIFKYVEANFEVMGHVVAVYKQNGEMRVYDPQTDNIYKDKQIDVLFGEECFAFQTLRVDNLQFDKDVISAISKRRVK